MKHHLTSAAHLLLPLALLGGVAHAQLKTGANPNTVTSTAAFEVEATSGNKIVIDKTTGNLGIGTTTPASTLSVNGSISSNYTSVTAATYTALATDSVIAWDGTAAGTITLPAAVSGAGNFKGRTYTIKNTSGAFSLAIQPSGTETINGSSSFPLGPLASIVVVSTGATSGITWQTISPTSTSVITGGTSSSGYDLSGLMTYTANIPGSRWTSGGEGVAETTDATADFPSADVAVAMNAMPQGGIIKLVLPANNAGSMALNFDLGLPDASLYLGKIYYVYVDHENSGIQSSSSGSGFNFQTVIPTASDVIRVISAGSSAFPQSGAVSVGTVIATNAYPAYPTYKPIKTPLFKIQAANANTWTVEYGVGYITNLNLAN